MSGPAQALRILVIDDNEGDCFYVADLLRNVAFTRYEVDWAASFEQGLALIAEARHDAYLVDHQLGTRTGIELLSVARQTHGTRPFIMLTGMRDSSVDRDAMREGAADFLVKDALCAEQLERSIRYAIERNRLLVEKENAANNDPLTGLANRRQFRDYLSGAIARAERSGQSLGLLFIDLDHFKAVNDLHGHEAGDRVLSAVARLLGRHVRRGDLVARLGGDEFAVVLDNVGAEHAALVADKILHTLRADPIALGDAPTGLGMSVGVALYPLDAGDAESLLSAADTAMYEAKDNGRNTYRCFEAGLRQRALRRADIFRSLAEAIQARALGVHYQAQMNVVQGRLRGIEALLRWKHRGEAIAPAEFIPIAEKSRQIGALGEWALRTAALQFREWELRGLVAPPTRLAVNVSALQIVDGKLYAAVERMLHDTGLEPARLELEITETAPFGDIDAAAQELRRLRRLGVAIALDDFGKDHTSLARLQKLPVQTLKIDRAFVAGCVADEQCAVAVKSTLGIAADLGLEVVGEGIENHAQRRFLLGHGCEVMQGFLFHRPCTAGEFAARLETDVSREADRATRYRTTFA